MKDRIPRASWFGIFIAVLALADARADDFDAASKAATESVQLQVENAKLEADWRIERSVLESSLQLINERASDLEEKRDLAKSKSAKDRAELDELHAKIQRATEDAKALDSRLDALANRLIALRPKLPPLLSDALEMSYRSLATPSMPTGERLQIAINALNRCTQFNRTVTVGNDVLSLDGPSTAKSFDVIYWGLSHGYAIDRLEHRAWFGAPTGDRWTWKEIPGAFNDVAQLIAVANGKADPEFVAVPAQVSNLAGAQKP